MRAAAIAHSYLKSEIVEPFRDARVNVFRGNTLEPNDLPDVAMVFGGDGAVHRVLPSLAYTRTPLLVVPTGSANDLARWPTLWGGPSGPNSVNTLGSGSALDPLIMYNPLTGLVNGRVPA